ncbi:MAG: hypothetical protein L3J88_03110 [Gammaproteobacteria bacterium]|nr:hypothetical protein [Gammaproteobacteria bacterium]MCF6362341.1 hypothetical protein [Gammaproteobacteria bacterium]
MSSNAIKAILLVGVACGFSFTSPTSWAASCCGGGSSSSLIMPKFSRAMVNLSVDMENYNGFWDSQGDYRPDPEGSDLNQYRINLGYAHRFASRWQGSVILPYVWNNNDYTGLTSNTQGLGDTTLNLWYESFDKITCVWKVRKWADLKPAVYLGGSLTVPTGVSRFDSVANSFDITGRGFYRLDANMLVEKTIYPWNVLLSLSYGKYLERNVNRDYGNYVEPSRRKLGDRKLATLSGGYTYFLESMDTLTFTLAYSHLQEGDGRIDGRPDPSTRMEKNSLAGTVAWSTMDRDWIFKGTLSHAVPRNDWGENFPVTNTLSFEVSHVLR